MDDLGGAIRADESLVDVNGERRNLGDEDIDVGKANSEPSWAEGRDVERDAEAMGAGVGEVASERREAEGGG